MRSRLPKRLWADAGLVHFSAAVVLMALLPATAYGHKLNVFASAEGKTIQGKVYFSGGTPAQDVVVTALSPACQQIGQTKSNDEGRFMLEARFRCDHRLLADTGDGHGGEYTLTASVLPKDLPPLPEKEDGQTDAKPSLAEHAQAEATPSVDLIRERLDQLRAELVRLQEQLNAYEDHTRLTDIIGGIGYIVGITGAAYYYLGSRRKRPGG
jgi:nickel transport protein